MPVDVMWDDEAHTRILAIYDGKWTWDDLHTAFSEIVTLTDTISHPVCVVHDVKTNIASRTTPTPHIQYFMKNIPDAVEVSIVVVRAPYIRKLIDFSLSIINTQIDYFWYFKFAKDLDEAREIARHSLTTEQHLRQPG